MDFDPFNPHFNPEKAAALDARFVISSSGRVVRQWRDDGPAKLEIGNADRRVLRFHWRRG
jgi:hypothetical protein